MTVCPSCNAKGCTKDGIIKGKQRYKGKSCGYRHTVKYLEISPEIKRQALQLYLEGLGFRLIGQFLNCSHVAVYSWIKVHGESIESLRFKKEIEIVELDEMHTYIGSKRNYCWIWMLLIAMEKDFSIAKCAPATRQQGENQGKPLKTKT